MGVLHRLDDDRAVDLHEVHRELAQHLEARVAGTDVVQGEPESEPAQARGVGDHMVEACVRALGYLQDDLLGLKPDGPHGITSWLPARLSWASDWGFTFRNSSAPAG